MKKELKNLCGGVKKETIDKALRIENVRKCFLQFKLLRGWKIDTEELEYIKHIPELTSKKRKIYSSRQFILSYLDEAVKETNTNVQETKIMFEGLIKGLKTKKIPDPVDWVKKT